jgi:succinate-semialdehyde dehydrogenase / glutarate-semialdehyde dehydrogenase
MQAPDSTLAQDIVKRTTRTGTPGLPPRISPAMLRELAATASLLGGPHETHPVIAPFTGRPITDVWMGGPADVRHAAARARAAQPAWAATPLAERAAVLLRVHDLMMERIQEAMDLVQLEAGKARIDAFIESMDVAVVARYYAIHGPEKLQRSARRGFIPFLSQTTVGYHPKGVVGVIAPWNYPLTMAITDALPALLAGNAIVIKPAEATPLSALWAARLLYDAGLPPELLHVVPGRGSDIGPELIGCVDFLQFTGSTATGRVVSEQAGRRLIDATLELGGKNPMIIREDADLARSMPGIIQSCFSCAGQLCISTERIYVHRQLFDEFVDQFRQAAEELILNTRFDFSGQMGSLVSQDQLDKVTQHVEDARHHGATVVTGGHALPDVGPFFYAPTILTSVGRDMMVFGDETFGPVVSVYPVDSDAEAVALANDIEYGLHATVWTRDLAAGRDVAHQIQCGTVAINDAYVATWGSMAAPMGGFKASGQGRRHGPEGLLKYTEPQTVTNQLLGPLASQTFGLDDFSFAGVTRTALRLIRHIPGLR